MIFNKTAYYIPIKTNNGTNTKDYSKIFDNHSISIDFVTYGFIENESALIVREGGDMGLYMESPNLVKFKWFDKSGMRNEIITTIDDVKRNHNVTINIGKEIEFYLDQVLVNRTKGHEIKDCSNKRFLIGAESPYSGQDEKWFWGEINHVLVCENSFDITKKNSYIKLDFLNNSKFKTFDESGSGNHGVLYENPKDVEYSISEYNKMGPKQKII